MSRASSGSKSAARALRNRIVLVMTVILLLSTIVSGYCLYLVLQSTDQHDRSAAPQQEIFVIAGKLAGLVKTLHQLEDQFLGSQDLKSLELFNGVLAQLAAQGRDLESAAGRIKAARTGQIAASIIQTAGEYESSLNSRVQAWKTEGVDNAVGLQGKLRAAAEEIANITPVSEPKKMAEVLAEVTAAEAAYLSAGTAETLGELEIASNTLNEIIQRATLPEPEKGLLQKGIKNYIGALNRYQAVSLATEEPALQAAFATEQERQKEVMRSTARELESVISNLQVSPLEAKITLIRQYEKEYQQNPADQNVTLMNQAIGDAVQQVEVSSLPQEQKEALLQALAGYREAFNSLADLDRNIHDAVSQSAHYRAQLDSLVKQLPRQPAPAPKPLARLTAFITRPDVLPAAAAMVALLLFGIIAAGGLTRSATACAEKQSYPKQDRTAGHEPALSEPDAPRPAEAPELPPGFDDILVTLEQTARQLMDLSNALPGVVKGMAEQNQAVFGFLQSRVQPVAGAGPHSPVDPEGAAELSLIAGTAENISEELDMLALNAAIKAERAGTHGREFVHVAEELEKLAQRSAEAARNLSGIIEAAAAGQDEVPAPTDDAGPDEQDIFEMNAANTRALDAMAVEINIIIDQAREMHESIAEFHGTADRKVFSDDDLGELESFDEVSPAGQDETGQSPQEDIANDTDDEHGKA